MRILGVYEGHNGTACLMVDGAFVAAASEERFTGRKNEVGYPRRAIDYCLAEAGLQPSDLDAVAVATIDQNLIWTMIQREASFSVEDYVHEQHAYFKPTILERRDQQEVLWNYIQEVRARKGEADTPYDFRGLSRQNVLDLSYYKQLRIRTVADHLGIDPRKIQYIDHHTCHQYYAYFASPFRQDTLILTADGVGDRGVNASVALARDDRITTVMTTTNCQVARIYRYITLLLGMKPFEHEYKVMGLAPYATTKELEKSYRVFEELLEVEGLDFVWKKRPKDLYFHFRDRLEGHRFDGIAGALQRMTEDLICRWAANAVAQTGVGTVVFAGGVAMNIKLNLALAELPEVTGLHVAPNPADESNAFGACYVVMETARRVGHGRSIALQPIEHAYLGPAPRTADVRNAILAAGIDGHFRVREHVTDRELARHLADGRTIGLCRGRMEFGARALGNRSIVADPSHPEMVKKINAQIKYRDFWMPFTPSVLEERADDYFYNPKAMELRFMTVGVRTRALAHAELAGALHPADLTARPQFVSRAANPAYHGLIREFESLTGIGGVLNTSLNLHGHPMVNTPAEAMFTMVNSELDVMHFGELTVERCQESP